MPQSLILTLLIEPLQDRLKTAQVLLRKYPGKCCRIATGNCVFVGYLRKWRFDLKAVIIAICGPSSCGGRHLNPKIIRLKFQYGFQALSSPLLSRGSRREGRRPLSSSFYIFWQTLWNKKSPHTVRALELMGKNRFVMLSLAHQVGSQLVCRNIKVFACLV